MLSRTKVSKGYRTVVPKEIRTARRISGGDVLEWAIEHERIVVRARPQRTIEDVVGLISHGGDAAEDKRRLQRGQRVRR